MAPKVVQISENGNRTAPMPIPPAASDAAGFYPVPASSWPPHGGWMAPPPPLGYPWPYAPPAAQDHSPPPQQQHFAPPPQPPYPAYPSSGLPEAAPEPEKAVEIDVDVANQVPEVSTVRPLIPPPPSALPSSLPPCVRASPAPGNTC